MWLRDVDEATNILASMLFDICYATNNHGDGALAPERERRAGGVGSEVVGGRRGGVADSALGARDRNRFFRRSKCADTREHGTDNKQLLIRVLNQLR